MSVRYVPTVGDLVGVKRLGCKGIVLETHTLPMGMRLFGTSIGTASVLVEGQMRVYGWSDIYQIPPDEDEDEDDGPEAA